MVRMVQDEDLIKLGQLDVRVLVALLRGKMSAYEIAQQCQEDGGNSIVISKGSLSHALKSLESFMFINKTEIQSSHTSIGYQITNLGRQILTSEIMEIQRLLTLAKERST